MHLTRMFVLGGALSWAVCGIGNTESLAQPRCELSTNGVEYRTYLPDGQRYIYVSVKSLSGFHPSVFVMADKSYEASSSQPVKNGPHTAWWLDRTKPMWFSTNLVKLRWKESGTLQAVTSWLTDPDWTEITQPFRGLEPDGNRFRGTGSADTNTYAFQTRVEMPDFSGDEFDVVLPALTFEGVTVSPPVVHFERVDKSFSAKC